MPDNEFMGANGDSQVLTDLLANAASVRQDNIDMFLDRIAKIEAELRQILAMLEASQKQHN